MRPCFADLIVCRDPAAAAQEAADRIACAAMRAVSERGVFYIAVPGGTSPRGAFERLASDDFAGRVPWEKTHLFFTDERCVPPYHEDSNYKLARDLLLSKVPIPESNVHRFRTELAPTAAAAEYQDEMKKVVGDPPRFDVVLLGMGADTHVASLYPHCQALAETTRLALAHYVAALRAHRLTLTLPVLCSAASVIMIALGQNKAAPVREVLQGETDPEARPAQAIRPTDGRLVWLLDAESASDL